MCECGACFGHFSEEMLGYDLASVVGCCMVEDPAFP